MTVRGQVDPDSHPAEAVNGGQAVLSVEESADPGGASGQGAEHDAPVGDGLISRYGHFSPQRGGFTDTVHILFLFLSLIFAAGFSKHDSARQSAFEKSKGSFRQMDDKTSVLQQPDGGYQFLVAVELDPEDTFLEFPVMVDAYILDIDIVDRQDGGDLRD
jgi:hypothetical protein